MESFANYLRYARIIGARSSATNLIARNISSTCNTSGSVIWASAKNIKPIVDANCHTAAIEFAYHHSPMRFSPIHYQNPGSNSLSPSGQTILFGCPLELRTVGELKKIPPILEYLLDSINNWHTTTYVSFPVGQKRKNCTYNSLYSKVHVYWPLVHELERAWTGVEETDRAIIIKLVPQEWYRRSLIMVCPLRYTTRKLIDFVGILYGPSTASMDRPGYWRGLGGRSQPIKPGLEYLE